MRVEGPVRQFIKDRAKVLVCNELERQIDKMLDEGVWCNNTLINIQYQMNLQFADLANEGQLLYQAQLILDPEKEVKQVTPLFRRLLKGK